MSSTDLVKNGSRPEMLFKVTLSPDGTTYQKEISLVFPKYASADLPHYKEEFDSQSREMRDDCQWHFQAED
ncbi:MAG: hypothetical protein PWQ75_1617 [Methanolobus sp.]|uniref:Uncharacterized protein n=1 Tax=Methanolobus tindarius DSM 2278 TaxID=1090322 RepID=W9DXD2_METTI|nr:MULTISPECIES: hypothetical protein [Methanolobus]ETA68362.1 hypothetical protein MettiDRAFT_1829 [Methanolobus tindarius DSM 2278]MDK2831865.1 hypothetical protein [Methanolobus sp.]